MSIEDQLLKDTILILPLNTTSFKYKLPSPKKINSVNKSLSNRILNKADNINKTEQTNYSKADSCVVSNSNLIMNMEIPIGKGNIKKTSEYVSNLPNSPNSSILQTSTIQKKNRNISTWNPFKLVKSLKSRSTHNIGRAYHSTVSLSGAWERRKNIYFPFKKKRKKRKNKWVMNTQINLSEEVKQFEKKKEMKLVKRTTLNTNKTTERWKKEQDHSSSLFIMLI